MISLCVIFACNQLHPYFIFSLLTRTEFYFCIIAYFKTTVLCSLTDFFFVLFPIWGHRIEFSIPTFSGLLRFLSLYSCLLHVFSYNIKSLCLIFGLPIFRCPPTSINISCSHYYIFFSLSTWPDDLSLASLIFVFMFATRSHLLLLLFLHS